ncbi:amine-terminal domain cyclin (macronuclear) [Tetrahymena thermophila SB210]|uniref:Amine-terminal domain cyclin n=1 Tax=Tetrahymena thermophila (strain SB210) TaxID=312017 RepID=I7MJK2_TETTS|nr:amine-terminal domain cyclin [Tetrahymena thermophila SB210]EAS06339.1 amine-terminal domain cyclin [Tetrahymena thermophila SB210]|eukprot:XP_001026584.1 amine-terminal domain cyclin [Tetrahymena thermophila SB210]
MFSSIASSAKGSQNKEIKIPVGNQSQNCYNYQQTFQSQQQLQQPQQAQPLQQGNQRKPSISSVARPQKFSISIQNKDQSLQQEILSDDRNLTYHKKKQSYQQMISSNHQGSIQNQKKSKQSINLNNLQNLNLASTNNNIIKGQQNQQNQQTASTFSIQNAKNQYQQSQQQFSSATLNSQNKNSAKDFINYKILQIQANSSKNQSISNVQMNGNLQPQNQIQTQMNVQIQGKSNQFLQNHGSGNSSQQLVITSARRNESSSVNVRQRGNEQIKNQNNRQDQSDLKDQTLNQYEDILKEKQNILQHHQNTMNQTQSKMQPSQQQVMINNYTYHTSQNNLKNVSSNSQQSQNINNYHQVSNIENNINNANTQQIQERPKQNSQQQNIGYQTTHNNHKSINIQQSQNQNINNYNCNIENNINSANLQPLLEKNKFNVQQQHFNSNTLNSYSFLSNNNNISSTSNFSSFGTLPKGTSASILKQQQQQQQQQQNTQTTINSMLLHLQQNDLQKNYFLNQQKIQNSSNNGQNQYAYQKNNQLEINSASNLALTDQDALKELLSKTTSTKSAIKNAANYFSSQQHKQQVQNNINLQQEEKPGFQSERLNNNNNNTNNTQFILQNQVAQKKNECINNQNKINVQSHLKVQNQQKAQNNPNNSQAVEQMYQNQAPIQRKIQEKIQKFTQIQTQIQNYNPIQTQNLTQNSNKSHLKANPISILSQVNSYGIVNNSKQPTPAIPSVSSVSSTQNLHQQKTNETLSNFTVSPSVPSTQVQITNQIGLLSSNSNNSTNNNNINNNYYSNLSNKAEYPHIQNNQIGVNNISQLGQLSGQCSSNNNNTTQNSALNQNNHKNLLSTAIKSETTQVSNFSQDSPLVCNENLSGILTNRYGDNSQFKNLLSCKSNNMSSNNINPGTYNSNTSNNIHQNSSSFTQTLSENKDKIQNNIQIQNYISTQHQTSQINSKIGITNIQLIEEYDNSIPYSQSQQSQILNNYGAQPNNASNSQSNNNNNINNSNCGFKPTHKKNLSNHLINKLGAICKSATEGSQTYTQSSQNNSQNKDSFNNNNNTLSSNQNKTKNNTVSISLNNNNTNNLQSNTLSQVQDLDLKKEDTVVTNYELEVVEESLKDSIEQFSTKQNVQINKIPNNLKLDKQKNKEQKESLEQQLLNFQHQNILSENFEYRIKDMKEQEIDYLPNPDYFDNQTEITCMMRCILFDWMFDVCMSLMLKRETVYLSLNYVDRYLSQKQVTKLNLQLVGAVSLYMACKIEEIQPPSISEFAKCTDDGYTVAQIVEYELLMLKAFDWKLNPPTQITWLNMYTEIWDRFIKSSFDKPNKYQINFVQDQKISNKNYLILYRIPEQKSYMLFRQMVQILDLMQLDANVLRFESRMLIASLMYLQLGIYYKQFTKKQVHSGFNEKYLFANSLNNFNEYFNSFLTQHFQFNLIDILSTLQHVATFFDVEYNYSLSPAAQMIDPTNNEMSYEEYLSYQTYFPNGIDYIRKRYCS